MDASFFKDKKITVFGFGLHGGGVGVVTYLVEHGAKIIVTDLKTKEQLATSLEKLKGLKNITYVLGQHRGEDVTNTDMVIKNPAVPWSDKHITLALEKKIPVEMDSSLFFKLCKNPIIGVTGTKGKTTTAAIIYQILKSAGKNAVKVGVSQASVLDKLESLKKDTVVVFELSSWRLSALGRAKMSPHIAVITNILRDHLNYYGTMEKYLADKKYIFANQKPKDFLVINNDDEMLCALEKESPSQTICFSSEPLEKSCGVFLDGGAILLNDGNDVKKLIDVKDLLIAGAHNVSNVMAAAGAAWAFGISVADIKKGILEFKGVAHRLEFIKEINGVKYYNDTAATIPEAAISALRSFDQSVVLIAGGTDKNLEFADFAKEIVAKTNKVVLLKGSATEKIILQLKKLASSDLNAANIEVVDSMEAAVLFAQQKAEKGDVVLLSPGAASFGLFANEFDRGDTFREAVEKLK